jgi:hypothetical protein
MDGMRRALCFFVVFLGQTHVVDCLSFASLAVNATCPGGYRDACIAICPETDRTSPSLDACLYKCNENCPFEPLSYNTSLFETFGANLFASMAPRDAARAQILSGPVYERMNRGGTAGKAWTIQLGHSQFKVSIEDVSQLRISSALPKLEPAPVGYRRAFEIVSEPGKNGVAFYQSLGGALGHGTQDLINLVAYADHEVVVHEAGHVIEQRVRFNNDPNVLDRWQNAIETDGISVSNYGNANTHEDQAEYARVFAACMHRPDGSSSLDDLRALSPARYDLWVHMQNLAGALAPKWARFITGHPEPACSAAEYIGSSPGASPTDCMEICQGSRGCDTAIFDSRTCVRCNLSLRQYPLATYYAPNTTTYYNLV